MPVLLPVRTPLVLTVMAARSVSPSSPLDWMKSAAGVASERRGIRVGVGEGAVAGDGQSRAGRRRYAESLLAWQNGKDVGVVEGDGLRQ